jgi:hypothetical protein
MAMDACHEALGARLKGYQFGVEQPLRVRVDLREPDADERPLTIPLVPADDTENRRLRDL